MIPEAAVEAGIAAHLMGHDGHAAAIRAILEAAAPHMSSESLEWAIFRKADPTNAAPYCRAVLRSEEQANGYMRLNYVESAWAWLEVRKRAAPGAWAAK